jgi:two-component system sensor histidine kinase UhpB
MKPAKSRIPVGDKAKLRSSEQRLAGILDSQETFIRRLDPQFRLTYMNQTYARAFKLRIGDITFTAVHPDDEERARAALVQLHEPPYRGIVDLRIWIQGEWRWVRWENSFIRNAHGEFVEIQGVGIDITEWKRAEASLRESQALLLATERLAGIGGYRWDLGSDSLAWSDELYRIFGHDPRERAPTAAAFIAAVHPDDRRRIQDAIDAALAGTRAFDAEFRIIRSDGSERFIHSLGEVARDAAGVAVHMTGSSHDITEHKGAEASLRKSEERFRRYFELGLIGIAITSTDKRIMEVNDKTCEILGYERTELLQKTWQEITHPEDLPAQLAEADRLLAGDIDAYTLDKRYLRKDGTVVYTTVSVGCIRTTGGAIDHVVALIQDITERKRAEDSARQAHEQLRLLAKRLNQVREAEAGLLSRELHDEFGQMLTGIRMDLSWLASRLAGDKPKLMSKVSSSLAQVDATMRIVRNVAARLRPRILDELGLLPAIEWLVHDLQQRSDANVAFVSNTGATALTPDQATAVFRIVQESLSNIARHAGAKRIDVSLYAQDGSLTVEIRDDGKGVRENEMTSVESIGLLGMRERALAVGGDLTLESVAGRGTVVILRLPLEKEDA